MKRERRHELHENMVSQFLQQCLAFIRKNSNALSWGLLVVAVLALATALWYRSSKESDEKQRAEFDAVVFNASTDMKPDELLTRRKAILQNDKDKYRLSMTTYAIGLEYARQALVASGAEKKDLEDQANDYYSQVVNKYGDQVILVGKAHMGLGKIAEGRGDFNKAREEYQAVLMMSALAGYPLRDFAEEAGKALAQYKQPVAFATTEPSTQATSASAPSGVPARAPGPATASAPAK